MNLQIESPVLALAAGQSVALDDACGTIIRPCEGTLWITQEGELEDFVVGPGEGFIVSRDGRTVLQAMQPSQVAFLEARRGLQPRSSSIASP